MTASRWLLCLSLAATTVACALDVAAPDAGDLAITSDGAAQGDAGGQVPVPPPPPVNFRVGCVCRQGEPIPRSEAGTAIGGAAIAVPACAIVVVRALRRRARRRLLDA